MQGNIWNIWQGKCWRKQKKMKFFQEKRKMLENANLMQVVCNKFENRMTAFILAFIEDFHRYDKKFISLMAELLYLLSRDSALSIVVPFHAHDTVAQAIEELRKEGYTKEVTRESLRKYATECEKLLMISSTNDTIELVMNFIEYIMEKIQLVHSVNCAVQEIRRHPKYILPTWRKCLLLHREWCSSEKAASSCCWCHKY